RSEWLAFVKCIATDNVDDLKAASRRLNWKKFLQSFDTSGTWSNCDPNFLHTSSIGNSKHPFPTNPFFIAIFYNAQRCLRFMNESGVDFAEIKDNGFTAYHVLMSAIRFMTDENAGSASGSGMTEECKSLLDLFHRTLFTTEQQQRMIQTLCRFGMDPMSWGVFLGLANYVEYVLIYCSPTTLAHSDTEGLNERISFDVSDFTAENFCFFTSPISVLVDIYSQSTLAEIKALGIFRTGFLWKQWTEALYLRNRVFFVQFLFVALIFTFASAFFAGSNVYEYLNDRCSDKPFTFPYGLLTILIGWITLGFFGTVAVVYGYMRKERYRRSVGYPCSPRKNVGDILGWYLPYILAFPTSIFLLWIYLDTEHSCALLGQQIYPVSGCGIMLLLIAGFSQMISFLRHLHCLTAMMSSLYRS
uniref:Ion_trans domain-containing protein n=2 Tax=Macrostomum lignano TaxID=282301 RepID=A0A1I8HLH7_9PLAT